MESLSNENTPRVSPLFSFSDWKKVATEPKMRRIELALFFGIGIFLGIILKNIAINTFSIGYQDYTIQTEESRIDFNAVERNILAKGKSSFNAGNSVSAGICSQ